MNETHQWIRTVRCEDIPLREGRSVRLGKRDIAIFNLGDRFLAIDSRCPHKGGPLSEGIVSGGAVVCPLHAWKVDLETGAVVRPVGDFPCVETLPVLVQENVVLVGLPVEKTEQAKSNPPCIDRNSPASWSVDAGSVGEIMP